MVLPLTLIETTQQKNFCGDARNFFSNASYKPPLRENFLYITALAHTPKKFDFDSNCKSRFSLDFPLIKTKVTQWEDSGSILPEERRSHAAPWGWCRSNFRSCRFLSEGDGGCVIVLLPNEEMVKKERREKRRNCQIGYAWHKYAEINIKLFRASFDNIIAHYKSSAVRSLVRICRCFLEFA